MTDSHPDLDPDPVNQLVLRVPGASAIVMIAPRTADFIGDQQAQLTLANTILHRGAHGLRVWQLRNPFQDWEESFRVFFPVPAPGFLHGAGTLYLESLSFDYTITNTSPAGNGSVPRVVVYDGSSTLETFTEFPHNGGHVQLSLATIRRFQEALGVSLILSLPTTAVMDLTVTSLEVRFVTPSGGGILSD
jgi:hypothetical protein